MSAWAYDPRRRDSSPARPVLHIAAALRAKALLAAGRPAAARAAAAELLPRLTPGLLPAVLAQEALS